MWRWPFNGEIISSIEARSAEGNETYRDFAQHTARLYFIQDSVVITRAATSMNGTDLKIPRLKVYHYWQHLIEVKHEEIIGREDEVKQALIAPVEIKRSKKDPSVYLYYRPSGNKFISVVAKHLNGEGFIITAYLTRRIGAIGSEKIQVE